MSRQDETEFPQKQMETAFLHSLRLIDQSREYLQMHLQPAGDTRTMQALADMELEAARLERIFRELMELSAPETPLRKRPLDLCPLLEQAASLCGELEARCGTHLKLETTESAPCLVWGDQELAEQICFHLLSNALRACMPGGHITLGLHRETQHFVLFLEDDGCGLPDEESWLENRRRFLGGAQAGLQLCRRYCRQLGWELQLRPRTPQGTRAELYIPLPDRPFPIEAHVELCSDATGRASTALRRQLQRELYLLTGNHRMQDDTGAAGEAGASAKRTKQTK